jgi:hypothetical protein
VFSAFEHDTGPMLTGVATSYIRFSCLVENSNTIFLKFVVQLSDIIIYSSQVSLIYAFLKMLHIYYVGAVYAAAP